MVHKEIDIIDWIFANSKEIYLIATKCNQGTKGKEIDIINQIFVHSKEIYVIDRICAIGTEISN